MALAPRRAFDAHRFSVARAGKGRGLRRTVQRRRRTIWVSVRRNDVDCAESDQALAESVKKAGNVIVPVDATFEGASTEGAPVPPDGGFRTGPGRPVERKIIATPYGGLTNAV